jgi:hypothetical protein
MAPFEVYRHLSAPTTIADTVNARPRVAEIRPNMRRHQLAYFIVSTDYSADIVTVTLLHKLIAEAISVRRTKTAV